MRVIKNIRVPDGCQIAVLGPDGGILIEDEDLHPEIEAALRITRAYYAGMVHSISCLLGDAEVQPTEGQDADLYQDDSGHWVRSPEFDDLLRKERTRDVYDMYAPDGPDLATMTAWKQALVMSRQI